MAITRRHWTMWQCALTTFAFLAYPQTAMPAEWWEGLFSYYTPESSEPAVDGTAGTQAERFRQQCLSPGRDDYPLHIQPGSLDGYEYGCSITKRTNVLALDAVILDLDCGSEGVEYRTRAILMQTDEHSGLAIYPGHQVASGWPNDKPREILQLYRCPANSPRIRWYE